MRDLVFVDESGVDTRLVRRYARAAPGERALGHAPVGRSARLTITGALALDGLWAPMSSPAAMNTDLFLSYVDQVLIPELVQKKPNAVVVLDNLKPHRAMEVREKLEAAGLGLLYLPPYSPDFAPIEQAWSKLKTLLRTRRGTHPRRAGSRSGRGSRPNYRCRCAWLVRSLRLRCCSKLNRAPL